MEQDCILNVGAGLHPAPFTPKNPIHKMNKSPKNLKLHAKEVLKRLKKHYPNVTCALNHKNTFELLVATILSAQCTDKRVNIVTESLFNKYKSPKDYADAIPEEFEQDIRSTGFYRNKTKNIIGMAQKVVNEFQSEIPNTMAKLITLPGVARKTANVVLSVAFNKNEGVTVDTHVKRISYRLGLTKNTNPEKVEKDLMQLLPQKDWETYSISVINHGRQLCIARKPKCQECFLSNICPRSIKNI